MILKSKTLVKIISFNFARAMALFPFIIINNEHLRSDRILINHEKIHIRQQGELLVVFFYLWYFSEFFLRFLRHKSRQKAYENISFEREAYANECRLDYLKERKIWSFWKYL
ncbi:MAG: hypothetical protein ACI8ZX_001825 [Planctomycetota bacterium]|jgi:hypothetical protein